MAEWLKATDCKSVLVRVRRFESYSAHIILMLQHGYAATILFCIVVTVLAGKAVLAGVAQLVERQPSKL